MGCPQRHSLVTNESARPHEEILKFQWLLWDIGFAAVVLLCI
jgi:hypothetical protein